MTQIEAAVSEEIGELLSAPAKKDLKKNEVNRQRDVKWRNVEFSLSLLIFLSLFIEYGSTYQKCALLSFLRTPTTAAGEIVTFSWKSRCSVKGRVKQSVPHPSHRMNID